MENKIIKTVDTHTKAIALNRINLCSLLNDFIASLDIKPQSKKTYSRCLKQFFNFLNNNKISLANTNREHILFFKNHLREIKLSAYTISNYIVAVRKFYEYLESKKIYPNVAKNIKGMRGAKGFKKDALTVSQVKDFLNSIDRTTLEGKRDFAIANILVHTGLRTIEIVRADITDIKFQCGEAILYIQGKGRDLKDDFILLTDNVLNPLMDYLNARKSKECEPLFTSLSDRNLNKRLTTKSVSRIIKNNLIKNNLVSKRLSAHSLRHTAITLSLLAGATIQETQRLARHSNINTTMIYAQNINRISNAPERKIQNLLARA